MPEENGRYTDPTENVIELVKLQALRQDQLRDAETRRVNERDAMREVHRLELAEKDIAIAEKESERIDAVAAVEKAAVAARFVEQQNALALATTASDLKASALAKEQVTTASALAATNAANLARSAQQVDNKSDSRWVIGLLMAVPSVILAVVALVVLFGK